MRQAAALVSSVICKAHTRAARHTTSNASDAKSPLHSSWLRCRLDVLAEPESFGTHSSRVYPSCLSTSPTRPATALSYVLLLGASDQRDEFGGHTEARVKSR